MTPSVGATDRRQASPTSTWTLNNSPELLSTDVKLTVKVLDKECFGTAGCNLEYKVLATWPPSKVARGDSYAITYEVSGPEDGKQIGTLIVNDDETFKTEEDFASTKNSSVKLKAAVTDISKNL